MSVRDAEQFVGTHHKGHFPVGAYVDDGFGNGVLRPNRANAIRYFLSPDDH